MKYVYSHDLSHVKTTDWIILGVRQSYFSLYFTVIVTIVDRMVICVFRMLEQTNQLHSDFFSLKNHKNTA